MAPKHKSSDAGDSDMPKRSEKKSLLVSTVLGINWRSLGKVNNFYKLLYYSKDIIILCFSHETKTLQNNHS